MFDLKIHNAGVMKSPAYFAITMNRPINYLSDEFRIHLGKAGFSLTLIDPAV